MFHKQDIIPLVYGTTLFRFIILILLFIALLYGQQALVILSVLLLTLFSLARVWCHFSQRGLECHINPVKEKLFPGESTLLKVKIKNHKFLPIWLEINVVLDELLNIEKTIKNNKAGQVEEFEVQDGSCNSKEIETGKKPDTATEYNTKTTAYGESSLLWKEQAEWNWELRPATRGLYCAGPLYLSTGDIFGFYRSGSETPLHKTITVFPRLVTLNPFSPLFKELFGNPGSKSPVVDPTYLASTRDYCTSRPARHIHWKASARHDQLQEKVFEPSTQEKVMLVIDVSDFSDETNLLFEKMLEVVASLAVYFETKGRTFGLVSNGTITAEKNQPDTAILPNGFGSQQLLSLLDMLARLKRKKQHLPLTSLLQQTIQGSGITALYFSYSKISSDKNTIDLFSQLKIPVIQVTAQIKTSHCPESYSLDQLINNGESAAG